MSFFASRLHFLVRFNVKAALILAVASGLVILAVFLATRPAAAEIKWGYQYTYCFQAYTPTAQYNPGFDGYETRGINFSWYWASGNCTPGLDPWYNYVQARGWNDSGGWHIVEWYEVWAITDYFIYTPMTLACGEYVCDTAEWYIAAFHYFQRTQTSSPVVLYTSNDGSHSTSTCFFSGCY